MPKEKKEKQEYFEEALSDFVYDVASGKAIRHLVDRGYTTEQIMRQLDFPSPRARVEATVYRYMLESGILLETLPVPEDEMEKITLKHPAERELIRFLRKLLEEDGEENSYVACMFGTIRRDRERRIGQMFGCLTGREREYLLGIPWPMRVIYHRLNSRMFEIGVQLALHSGTAFQFYFFKSRKIIEYTAKEQE